MEQSTKQAPARKRRTQPDRPRGANPRPRRRRKSYDEAAERRAEAAANRW